MAGKKLQQELKKKNPFASVAQEASLEIVRTSDQLQLQFQRLFREHGLTPSQYNILRILRGAGEPLPILEIASRTVTVVPGITGLIDRLEQAEMVVRERCLEDRRVIFVRITAKGQQVLSQLDIPVLDLHEHLLSQLTSLELTQLIQLLGKARQSITAATVVDTDS